MKDFDTRLDILRALFPRCCLMPSEYGENSRRDGQERLCHLGRYKLPRQVILLVLKEMAGPSWQSTNQAVFMEPF
ncbi:hypothetical protein CapIbe_010893 [Capra ibex]